MFKQHEAVILCSLLAVFILLMFKIGYEKIKAVYQSWQINRRLNTLVRARQSIGVKYNKVTNQLEILFTSRPHIIGYKSKYITTLVDREQSDRILGVRITKINELMK